MADAPNPDHWIFVEDAHLLDVARATSLGAVASAARTRRDWLARLNKHARALVFEHPDLSDKITAFMREHVVTSEDRTLVAKDIGPVLMIRVKWEQFSVDSAGYRSIDAYETEPMAWYWWLAMLDALGFTRAYDFDEAGKYSPSRWAFTCDRILQRGNIVLHPVLYFLCKMLLLGDDILGHAALNYKDGLGCLLLEAAGYARDSARATERFGQVLDMIELLNTTFRIEFYLVLLDHILYAVKNPAVLEVFYTHSWVKIHWRYREQLIGSRKPDKTDAIYRQLNETMFTAYRSRDTKHLDAILELARFANSHDLLGVWQREKTGYMGALQSFVFLDPPDLEDADAVRQYEGIRQWLKSV